MRDGVVVVRLREVKLVMKGEVRCGMVMDDECLIVKFNGLYL